MQKVITINLNGNAYQLDESGYEALSAYLATAARELEGNPDRAEITADLEQAIADKCQRFLGPHKSVVTAAEVEQIVREMGPIDATPGDSRQAHAGSERTQEGPGAPAPKRLFRIPEGAVIAGVCKGLAAYSGLDVTIVRLIFVVLGFLSGVGIVTYIVLMFVMPEATPEERAAAGGAPFNAQEVVDRVKRQYAEGTRELRRHWRQQQRQWRRYGAAPAVSGPPPRLGVALLPVFGLIHLALFLAMAVLMISLVNTGEFLGNELPEDVPLWAAALLLLVVYQILVSPIRAAAHWSQAQPAWYSFWNAVIGLTGLAVVVWFASHHVPELREFAQNVPELMRDFGQAMRDLFD